MTTIEQAAQALGIELLPWQREAGARILAGEQVVMPTGKGVGRKTLIDVLNMAWKMERTSDIDKKSPTNDLNGSAS